jgi:hypothetical protein
VCGATAPAATCPGPGRRRYNNLSVMRSANDSGFGINETQLHFHNVHNGAESDSTSNVHTSPARSTTSAGAPRWRGGTKSTPRRPIAARHIPTAMAALSTRPAISASSRERCGSTITASSSRRECLQGNGTTFSRIPLKQTTGSNGQYEKPQRARGIQREERIHRESP